MKREEIESTLDFLRGAEALKSTLRSGHTATGRAESTAEHTWRLCLMVIAFADGLGEVDVLKLIKMCLIHDLGEAVSGDVPAITPSLDKGDQEKHGLLALTSPLCEDRRQEILQLFDEYEAGVSPEAVLAKSFDKLETILQHNQGKNGPDFDYRFNLTYGSGQTSRHPLTAAIRAILDDETRTRIRDTS